MRILFWGTPDFAVPALQAVLGEGHEVTGVVTQPDRAAGRGRSLQPSPVKIAAQDEQLPIFQPEHARDPEFVAAIRAAHAEVSVVVAYGQLLTREVLDVPPRGSINVHASLLPALRGAAPINWAIRLGHETTGVTIMRMVERMDAGPIIHQVTEPIAEEETATDLRTRLSELGAEALVEALALIEIGAVDERPQDEARATYAPRLTRETTHVDWSDTADTVSRQIRAFDEIPGAWTQHGDDDLKVFRPQPVSDHVHDGPPGRVLEVHATDAAQGMLVACGTGAVWVREVKPAGKRRMTTAAWVHGRGIAAGDQLR